LVDPPEPRTITVNRAVDNNSNLAENLPQDGS
jgi:hypothetical protein